MVAELTKDLGNLSSDCQEDYARRPRGSGWNRRPLTFDPGYWTPSEQEGTAQQQQQQQQPPKVAFPWCSTSLYGRHVIMATPQMAQQQGIALIDLDKISQQLLEKIGPENSKMLFNWVEPGEHPNYPQGKQDDTHFSELGARRMAELVLSQIKALHLELAERIVKPAA